MLSKTNWVVFVVWILSLAQTQCSAQVSSSDISGNPSTVNIVDGLGEVMQVKVGGGGRFWVLRQIDRLAIFDFSVQKVTGHISLPSKTSVFAVGKNVLVLVDPKTKRLHRWSLPDITLHSVVPIELDIDVAHATIGADSDGPLLLSPDPCRWPLDEIRLLDLETLKPVVEEIELNGRAIRASDDQAIGFSTASDDGTTFLIGPLGFLLRFSNGSAVGRYCTDINLTSGRSLGRSGRYLYGGIAPRDMASIKSETQLKADHNSTEKNPQISIHDRSGPFYLSYPTNGKNTSLDLFYFRAGDSVPIGSLPSINLKAGVKRVPISDRVFFSSKANVIATLDHRLGRIHVYPLRLKDASADRGDRTLELSSQSKMQAQAGTEIVEHIQLPNQKPDGKFELVSGPDGMTVNESGELKWLPPDSDRDTVVEVCLHVSTPDHSTIHRLNITVQSKRQRVMEPSSTTQSAPKSAGAQWLVAQPGENWLRNGRRAEPHNEPIKIRLKTLPSFVQIAANGQLIVFRQPGNLSILDTVTGKVIAKIPAPHTGTRYASGADCVVVHDPINHTISRWQLSDLTLSHQVEAPFENGANLFLGACSRGPLLIQAKDNKKIFRLDSRSLQPLADWPIDYRTNITHVNPERVTLGHISANGTTLSVAGYYGSTSLIPVNNGYQVFTLRQMRHHFFRTSSDGKLFFSDKGVFDRYLCPKDLRIVDKVIFPAVSGPLFCQIKKQSSEWRKEYRLLSAMKPDAEAFHPSVSKPVSSKSGIQSASTYPILDLPAMKRNRTWFIPSIHRLIRFDAKELEFQIHHWDVETELGKTSKERPLIMSMPEAWVRCGNQWSYKLRVLSDEEINFRMPIAPRGMLLSETGTLTWDVPQDLSESKHRVVVVVATAQGKEENHAFDLYVIR